MPQQATPWAILLCKFSDNTTEPFDRQYYENLFTNAGTGLNNLVDFVRLYSHGNIDVGGSQVFGWLQLPRTRSAYTGSGANPNGRLELIQWARDAVTATGVDLSNFGRVVVCLNVSTDLFGGASGVVTPDGNVPIDMSPSMLAQEMLHGYGVNHSRRDGSQNDYQDPWDVMSTAVFPDRMATDPNFTRIGPGLNAANMAGRGWLDSQRVWARSGFFNEGVVLRPHHRRDLAGFLVARAGEFFVEFRVKEGWDAAIPRPAVLVHRFQDGRSYLMASTTGEGDLVQGSVFRSVDQSGSQLETRVEVTSIDAGNRRATVQISSQPTVSTTTVPFVEGESGAIAANVISAADLVPRFVGTGRWVVSQSPMGGAVVTRGTTVTCRLGHNP
jgi:PASTA domain